jgi:hypothetical protein
MNSTWLNQLRDQWRSIRDVAVGRAYAAYSISDPMEGVRARMALLAIQSAIANRSFVDSSEIRPLVEAGLE